MSKDNITVINNDKIYEVLDLIRRRPEIWLTDRSISSLQNFLTGYLLRGRDIHYPGEPTFDEFKYWILGKCKKLFGVGRPYSDVLLYECKGDEVKAFDRFFIYLEEFKKEMQKQ